MAALAMVRTNKVHPGTSAVSAGNPPIRLDTYIEPVRLEPSVASLRPLRVEADRSDLRADRSDLATFPEEAGRSPSPLSFTEASPSSSNASLPDTPAESPSSHRKSLLDAETPSPGADSYDNSHDHKQPRHTHHQLFSAAHHRKSFKPEEHDRRSSIMDMLGSFKTELTSRALKSPGSDLEDQDRKTFAGWLNYWLHSRWVSVLMLVLLLADMILVMATISIEMEWMSSIIKDQETALSVHESTLALASKTNSTLQACQETAAGTRIAFAFARCQLCGHSGSAPTCPLRARARARVRVRVRVHSLWYMWCVLCLLSFPTAHAHTAGLFLLVQASFEISLLNVCVFCAVLSVTCIAAAGIDADAHYGNDDLHTAEMHIIILSSVILSLFLVENLLLLLANGAEFFMHVLQVFDVIICSVSLYVKHNVA